MARRLVNNYPIFPIKIKYLDSNTIDYYESINDLECNLEWLNSEDNTTNELVIDKSDRPVHLKVEELILCVCELENIFRTLPENSYFEIYRKVELIEFSCLNIFLYKLKLFYNKNINKLIVRWIVEVSNKDGKILREIGISPDGDVLTFAKLGDKKGYWTKNHIRKPHFIYNSKFEPIDKSTFTKYLQTTKNILKDKFIYLDKDL